MRPLRGRWKQNIGDSKGINLNDLMTNEAPPGPMETHTVTSSQLKETAMTNEAPPGPMETRRKDGLLRVSL